MARDYAGESLAWRCFLKAWEMASSVQEEARSGSAQTSLRKGEFPHPSSMLPFLPSWRPVRGPLQACITSGERDPTPREEEGAHSQLGPEHRLVSCKLLVSEQHDAVGRAGGLSQTRWTWAFDIELIPKVEATLIHLSFSALSWRGRRGLVSGTRGSYAKRPRAHLKLR